jgi:hypothetical protein
MLFLRSVRWSLESGITSSGQCRLMREREQFALAAKPRCRLLKVSFRFDSLCRRLARPVRNLAQIAPVLTTEYIFAHGRIAARSAWEALPIRDAGRQRQLRVIPRLPFFFGVCIVNGCC